MSPIIIAILVAFNLGLIFLLLAAPLGLRTTRRRVTIRASAAHVWSAVWPLGANASWSGELLSAQALGDDRARVVMSWEGRDGAPIERVLQFGNVDPGRAYSMRVVDDSSLDPSFWADYGETTELIEADDEVRVVFSRTDRYRGLAFLVFRHFAMRREASKLKRWAQTGVYVKGGVFEHPLTQIGFAVLSAFILWTFFGLNAGGFVFAAVLTAVVALHELGHMAAFRLMGHRKVRMIFIPLLGGIAIGGRPYDSRFEVAFVALMGAGFSAFLVPVAMAASEFAARSGDASIAMLLAVLAGCAALFNLGNLVPVWKFDGGQVLRQICPNQALVALSSFLLLGAFLAIGHAAGLSRELLLAAGVVFAILSLITAGHSFKPRKELKPIATIERLAIAAALVAVFAIHGFGVIWAASKIV